MNYFKLQNMDESVEYQKIFSYPQAYDFLKEKGLEKESDEI